MIQTVQMGGLWKPTSSVLRHTSMSWCLKNQALHHHSFAQYLNFSALQSINLTMES
jgi:hypothetical protein